MNKKGTFKNALQNKKNPIEPLQLQTDFKK